MPSSMMTSFPKWDCYVPELLLINPEVS
jgi:hypothetical protein